MSASPIPVSAASLRTAPTSPTSLRQPPSDIWSHWLLHTRHGGDPAFDKIVRTGLETYAQRVVDGAQLAPGMRLVDIGSGDGLIAFHAIDRVGPDLRVVLTDISALLLRYSEALSAERGVRQQCSFMECPADNLSAIPDASVDAVTTRAVLAYVDDKVAALREFYRILKPGGRLSLAEPIFYDDAVATCVLRNQMENGAQDRLSALLYRWKAAQFPDSPERMALSPITNFSERRLFEWIRACGFSQLHMELHVDLYPSRITSWETFLNTSPHPWAPTLSQLLAERFSAEERTTLEASLRAHVESGRAQCVDRTAYFTASKTGQG